MPSNGDEIEFFGFLPIAFTKDLEDSLVDGLEDIFKTNNISSKIRTHINASFKKNFFIFNNFVLRNILKFPNNFKLERKITDKIIKADLSDLISKLQEKQKNLIDLKTYKAKLDYQLNHHKNINNGYKNLLKNKENFEDLIIGSREIKAFLKDTTEIFEKYQMNYNKKESNFDKLLEYKNIKNEYYKNEKNRLLEIASIETLEKLNRQIN